MCLLISCIHVCFENETIIKLGHLKNKQPWWKPKLWRVTRCIHLWFRYFITSSRRAPTQQLSVKRLNKPTGSSFTSTWPTYMFILARTVLLLTIATRLITASIRGPLLLAWFNCDLGMVYPLYDVGCKYPPISFDGGLLKRRWHCGMDVFNQDAITYPCRRIDDCLGNIDQYYYSRAI